MQRINLSLLKAHLEKTNPTKQIFKLIKSELGKQGYIIRKRKVKALPQKTDEDVLAQETVWSGNLIGAEGLSESLPAATLSADEVNSLGLLNETSKS